MDIFNRNNQSTTMPPIKTSYLPIAVSDVERQFESVVNETIEQVQSLLITKGREYRRNSDPYHNFNEGAKISGQIPEKVLDGFLLKHLISVNDITNDLKSGVLPTEHAVNEKFNDILVYTLIKKAMILNRINQQKDQN